MRRVSKKTLTVTNTEFADKLKKYLEKYEVPGRDNIIPERCNFVIASFYGAMLTITLIEQKPKQVQFYFNRQSATGYLKKVLERNIDEFWKEIERALNM